MPAYRLDLGMLSQADNTQWRLDMAKEWSDKLAHRVQRSYGAGPMDFLSIVTAVATDAFSAPCALEHGGYDANARLVADMIYERLMALKPAAMMAVARASAANPNARN